MYSNILMNHFENPKNVGSLINPTHKSVVGNPNTNSVIKLTVNVVNDIIMDIAFKCYGGCALIACMSLLTSKVKGMSIINALKITESDLNNELNLDSINYISSILAIDALKNLSVQTLHHRPEGLVL